MFRDGSSGGALTKINVASTPSLVALSETEDYVVLTYYVTESNIGKFYMRTLASGDDILHPLPPFFSKKNDKDLCGFNFL